MSSVNIFFLVLFSFCLLYQRGGCLNFNASGINKVTGGNIATSVDQFPFTVSIQVLTDIGYIHGCSGSICGKRHIITAGHCLLGRTVERILVLVGTIELNEKEIHPYRGQFFRPKKLIIHEDYSPPRNDIGIIEVRHNNSDKWWRYTIWGEINSQCNAFEGSLPSRIGMSLSETEEGTICTVTGWGYIQTPFDHEHPQLPNSLRYVDLPIYNHMKCAKDYSEAIGDGGTSYNVGPGTICAGYEQGGRATCFGDSGSSLVCNGKLVGIVSFGSRICGEPRKPGVFTEIFQYLTWISKHGCTLCSD